MCLPSRDCGTVPNWKAVSQENRGSRVPEVRGSALEGCHLQLPRCSFRRQPSEKVTSTAKNQTSASSTAASDGQEARCCEHSSGGGRLEGHDVPHRQRVLRQGEDKEGVGSHRKHEAAPPRIFTVRDGQGSQPALLRGSYDNRGTSDEHTKALLADERRESEETGAREIEVQATYKDDDLRGDACEQGDITRPSARWAEMGGAPRCSSRGNHRERRRRVPSALVEVCIRLYIVCDFV